MSSYTDEELIDLGLGGTVRKPVAKGPPPPLRPIDLASLDGLEPLPVRFLVQGLLPMGETTLLTAPGGGNKTTLTLMMAVAMAARLDQVLGMAIEPGPAVYIGMEDSEERLHWMLHHICLGLGVRLASLAGRLHVVSMRQVEHNGLAQFNYENELTAGGLYYQAQNLVMNTGSKLLVLDNLAHLFTGNENDRMQATRFMALCNRLASDTEAAVIIPAHTPKSGADFSGSTAWQNAVRSHASIEKEEGGDPEVRVLKVSKGNYVKPGEVTRFRWHDHYLIRPDDLPADIASTLAATSRATAANDAFLRCLAVATAQGRAVSHSNGLNYAPRILAKMPEAKGYDQEDFEGAMERLLHLGTILADQVVAKYANRTIRRGLKVADQGAQSPAQTPAQSPAQSLHKDAQSLSGEVHNAGAQSPPSPTGKEEGDLGPPSSSPWGDGAPGLDWMPGD